MSKENNIARLEQQAADYETAQSSPVSIGEVVNTSLNEESNTDTNFIMIDDDPAPLRAEHPADYASDAELDRILNIDKPIKPTEALQPNGGGENASPVTDKEQVDPAAQDVPVKKIPFFDMLKCLVVLAVIEGGLLYVHAHIYAENFDLGGQSAAGLLAVILAAASVFIPYGLWKAILKNRDAGATLEAFFKDKIGVALMVFFTFLYIGIIGVEYVNFQLYVQVGKTDPWADPAQTAAVSQNVYIFSVLCAILLTAITCAAGWYSARLTLDTQKLAR